MSESDQKLLAKSSIIVAGDMHRTNDNLTRSRVQLGRDDNQVVHVTALGGDSRSTCCFSDGVSHVEWFRDGPLDHIWVTGFHPDNVGSKEVLRPWKSLPPNSFEDEDGAPVLSDNGALYSDHLPVLGTIHVAV